MSGQEMLRASVHPVRALLWLFAALATVMGVVSGAGVFGVFIGILFGGVAGTLLAHSAARSSAVVAASLAAAVAVNALTHVLVTWSTAAALFGPVGTLRVSELLWYFGMSLVTVICVRVAAERTNWGGIVELGLLAGGVATGLAAHRDGAVARPLWLSDWAWHWGLNPTRVITSFGMALTIALAVVLLLQSRRRKSAFALLVVPLLAVLVVSILDFGAADGPPPAAEVAEVRSEMGDPPLPTDADGPRDGQSSDPDQSSGGDGGTGEDPGSAGLDGGSGEEPGSDSGGDGGTDRGSDTASGGDGGSDSASGSDGGTDSASGGDGGSDSASGSDAGSDSSTGSDAGSDSSSQASPPPPKPPNNEQPPPSSSSQSQPVAVVLLGDDYEPPLGYFYLRDDAQSALVSGRLVEVVGAPLDRDASFSYPARALEVPDPPPADGRVALHSQVAMLARHDRPFGLPSVTRVSPLKNPDPKRFSATYAVESLALDTPLEQLLELPVGDERWDAATVAHYQVIPEDPRYVELVEQILAELPDDVREQPMARVFAIKQWLDANVKYSKKHKHAGTADPTADFLFGDRIGFCVHNAHAAAYLWRAAGIPARVATGYAVEASRLKGSALVVMGSDAHAWPEVYVSGRGWVIIDIAPSEDLDPPQDPVDDDTVAALANMARMEALSEPTPPRDWSWLGRAARYLALSLFVTTVLATLLGHWGVKLWRRWRVLFGGPSVAPRVVYRLALDLLAEAGYTRAPGETRVDFAKRCGSVAPSFLEMTELHLAAQLGDPSRQSPDAPHRDPKVYKRLLRSLGRELEQVPWWRRVLGILYPFSFYRAR